MNKNRSNLDPALIEDIIQVILSIKGCEKVVLYGSRANGCATKVSDIDIAVFGPDWSSQDINRAKFALDEQVQTPLKFDVVNYYELTKEPLKENIKNEGIIIYESTTDPR